MDKMDRSISAEIHALTSMDETFQKAYQLLMEDPDLGVIKEKLANGANGMGGFDSFFYAALHQMKGQRDYIRSIELFVDGIRGIQPEPTIAEKMKAIEEPPTTLLEKFAVILLKNERQLAILQEINKRICQLNGNAADGRMG